MTLSNNDNFIGRAQRPSPTILVLFKIANSAGFSEAVKDF